MNTENSNSKIMHNKKTRKAIIISASSALILALIIGGCAIYLGDFYRADESAISAFAPMNEVDFRTLEDGSIVFTPESPIAGLIFYPGGKVENDAYKPLMASLASRGILCILVEMPFNLAVFDFNAADGICEKHPDIDSWYIGGHSLGGSMAASYIEKHSEDFDGLILLGSYSTADLSDTELDVLSIYGSEDKVMNREKYEASKSNLPSDLVEKVITGGCHAYFGMYGAQEGDGDPKITAEEQIEITANEIFDLIKEK